MIHDFMPGDFLIFQLEAGYGLLRVIGVENEGSEVVWHLAAYRDLFPDPDFVDAAIDSSNNLGIEVPHVALTNRAFESTQVAKMRNVPLTDEELRPYTEWKESNEREVFDRSIRLMLGLR